MRTSYPLTHKLSELILVSVAGLNLNDFSTPYTTYISLIVSRITEFNTINITFNSDQLQLTNHGIKHQKRRLIR